VNTTRDASPAHAPATHALAGARARWVVFRVAAERFALPLESVERIVRAAQVTPLPHSPAVVLGALDVQGEVLAVFDLRRRFGMPARELHPDQELLIANTRERRVVLVIDAAQGVLELGPGEKLATARIAPDAPLAGVLTTEDGLVLIHDLEKLLTTEEARALEAALEQARAHHA
jgi:purine-binding chemotaxis protein CheW